MTFLNNQRLRDNLEICVRTERWPGETAYPLHSSRLQEGLVTGVVKREALSPATARLPRSIPFAKTWLLADERQLPLRRGPEKCFAGAF